MDVRSAPGEDVKASEKVHGSDVSASESPAPAVFVDGADDDDDPKLDRALLWKRDVVMIPIMGLLYMLLFLDRTNIANARALGIGEPDGLEGALGMPSNGYNIVLTIFYIPFVLAEIPANLIFNLNKIPPRFFLGGQMVLLGILGMCQGLTRTYGDMLAVRFLMGLFEAALPAGATYMISLYYTKREATVRFAWFFNFALAGPFFSGLLAYAIADLDGVGGLQDWRWVFILEGLMTVAIAVPVVVFCPNFPHEAQAWFLRPAERDRLVRKLARSRGDAAAVAAADAAPTWRVLTDWRIHLFTFCFFCCDVTASSVSAFAPTILTQLGWEHTTAQLFTMPIWATGIVFAFAVTWAASRVDLRLPFILACICLQLAGWAIERAYVPRAGVRYLALFLMSAGTFPQMPMLMGWLSANLRGRRYLAVGMAWMVGFGNCANFVSSNVFITGQSPRYPTGFTTGLVFASFGFLLVCVGTAILFRLNKRREARRAQLSGEELERFDELYFKFVY
ncbi:major facilitator superfamily domain-containing protein [Xylariaceae sp. FL0804]|nr:major facilitator superfamily domain-containing protein [Xylariaceae sp. FL0804]